MIGLKRGIVKLSLYNPQWIKEFEKEKKYLLDNLGNSVIDIQHVGSTAIPGILSKPIIDIALITFSLKEARKLIEPLESLGYQFKKDDNIPGRLFFTKGPEENRKYYLHVIENYGNEWKKLILFRNYLRSHPDAVKEYEQLKSRLAKRFGLDRKSYTSSKDVFIRGIIKKASRLK